MEKVRKLHILAHKLTKKYTSTISKYEKDLENDIPRSYTVYSFRSIDPFDALLIVSEGLIDTSESDHYVIMPNNANSVEAIFYINY